LATWKVKVKHRALCGRPKGGFDLYRHARLGGFRDLIIGSVAQKVVSYSKVPVLVIKE